MNSPLLLLVVVFVLFVCITDALMHSSPLRCAVVRRSSVVLNAEVDIVWPNNKKTKSGSGSSLKEAAAKAGFKLNLACEQGKCGSCELLANGKTKIRPCVGKVPASGPITLKNP